MVKEFLSEIVIAVVMVLLILTLINPTDMLMTTATEMFLVIGLVLLFGLFALFVWGERVQDERDAILRMWADRIGFLAGSSAILIGIVVESLNHNLSDWLLIALAVMIVAKIVGSVYGKMRH